MWALKIDFSRAPHWFIPGFILDDPRGTAQRLRDDFCSQEEHSWFVLNESVMYHDVSVVTEVCLYCDSVQAFMKRRHFV